MELKFYSADGSTSSTKDFAIPQFEGDRGNKALRQVLLAYLANKRLGTHSTLNHATVHGTGKKPFRQKGTGRGRQGSMNGNQHYHGGTWKGPKPRDYSQKINKKMRVLALQRAIFNRASAGDLNVIERFEVNEPKTQLFNVIINRIQDSGRLLIVDDIWTKNSALAARNIERINLSEACNINALDLSQYKKIIVSEKGLHTILARINGETL
ncbi:MAG: 50S ribosomal protein L4 [Verrucomicrobiota bacterium]|nr:50S ribosomal protein L4 [Verrucomicrobiota bacterium]